MNFSQFIDDLVTEISVRSKKGYPDFTNDEDISILSNILDEWGLSGVKDLIIEGLLNVINPVEIQNVGDTINEIDAKDENERFKIPLLNKVVKYIDDDGKEQENLVGNLIRMGDDTPGRKAIEKYLPDEGTDERDAINQELGSEKDGETNVSPEAAKAKRLQKQDGEQEEDPEPVVNIFDDGKYEAPDLD